MIREINTIVIHCSDSSYGNAELIRTWHEERGFRDIGYHYVICNPYPTKDSYADGKPIFMNDGNVEIGRPLETEGAHVRGFNADSIGVCLIGKRLFTRSQFIALVKLITRLKDMGYGLSIKGHYELLAPCDQGKKTCPNLEMDWLRDLIEDMSKRIVPSSKPPYTCIKV